MGPMKCLTKAELTELLKDVPDDAWILLNVKVGDSNYEADAGFLVLTDYGTRTGRYVTIHSIQQDPTSPDLLNEFEVVKVPK